MSQCTVQLKWCDSEKCEGLSMPEYQSEHAAGMDIQAAVLADLVVEPGEIVMVETNIAMGIEAGHEVQVRPRSGLAIKHGITVVNAPGTIDADYRGEVKVGLINVGKVAFTIHRGDRIAQLVVAPVCHARVEIVAELDDTARGSGGFGHTGV
ncbi:MAG: dUTP diphosphatase [Desulfobulbaceae bacterium]|jgi:dUTP pyrophosphatase|nr:dUTP diphosphatase [Desulfobulbaceae bacterium]